MAFVPTTNGARVYCKHTKAGQEFGSVLWFAKDGFDVGNLQQLVNIVMQEWIDGLQSTMDSLVAIGPFVAYDMRTSDGVVVTATVSPVFGSNAVDGLPLKEAVCVTHRTSNRGRAYRGRTYVSGFCENEMTEGVWTSLVATNCATTINNIRTEALVAGWTFGVRSGQLDGVPRNPAIITPVSYSENRSDIPTSQRRRTRRN